MIPLGVMAGQAAADLVPNGFAFTDQSNLERSTLTYSNVVQITGLTGPAPVSCSGGAICTFSDAGGASPISGWTTSTTISNGQYIRARATTSSAWGTTVNCGVTIGGVSDTFSVTTGVVTPGSQTFTSSGTFNIPAFNNLTVQVVGGGGGGSGASAAGAAGGTSAFSGLSAAGGQPGNGGVAGSGGTASGGTTNTTGTAGSTGGNGGAGAGPFGGAGGTAPGFGAEQNGNPGSVAGGGGSGAEYDALPGEGSYTYVSGGGGGGYCARTYGIGAFTRGSGVGVTVGGGGAGGSNFPAGGNGARGEVRISWN